MPRKRFGELLLQEGYISSEVLEKFLSEKKPGLRIGERLLAAGKITPEQQARIVAIQSGLQYVEIQPLLQKLVYSPKFPLGFLHKHVILPLRIGDEGEWSLAMADPFDYEALEGLRMAFDGVLPYKLVAGSAEEIKQGLLRLAELKKTSVEDVAGKAKAEKTGGGHQDEELKRLRDSAEDAPVVRIVDLLISNAVRLGASDIHIERREKEFIVRYRIDGVLRDVEAPPVNLQPAVVSRVKLMARMNIAERRLPQDGRINIKLEGRDIDLRIATTPTIYGENVSIRILDPETLVLDFTQLGFPPDVRGKFVDLIRMPNGIILVTGPTGSGKTTTLYASLNTLNTPEKKIITLEDPVEYHLDGINQIQVNSKIDLTFAGGLRSIVRQDPDILMVGEIRDRETAGLAVNAALTGHLVFSTLHTNDAPSAVVRLIDLGVEPYLIASSLRAVLAQRLVRRLCPSCKAKYSVPDSELADFVKPSGKEISLYKGAGCENCEGLGLKGRTAIFELLVVDEDIQKMISSKADSGEIMRTARGKGFRTLKDAGWEKVLAGEISIEALREII